MQAKTFRADLLMLFAAALWGGAFVAQRAAMQQGMGPLTYNGVRFTLGAAALVPVAMLMSRRKQRDSASRGVDSSRRSPGEAGSRAFLHIGGGILAGLILCLAVNLQQTGLIYTTAAKAGFITGLYMPLVAVLGIFVGEKTGIATWIGAGVAVVGLYFLSITGPLRIERGDGLIMLCAAVWACHVLLIGKISPRTDPLILAIVQFTTTAIVSLVIGLTRESLTIAMMQRSAAAIAYGSFASVSIAYTLQLVGQKYAPPAHAAIILSLEAVFAGLTGYLILNERFGGRELLGAALMFGGMLFSQAGQILPKRRSAANALLPAYDDARAESPG